MNNKVSTEYAQAIFALAWETGMQEQIYNELQLVNNALLENPEYNLLLVSPSITRDQKHQSLDEVFGSLCEHTVNFLKLLVDRGRISIIPECVKEYESLYNASKNTAVVTVVSAVPLNDEQKQKIITKLSKKYGKSIELVCEIDENMLGGLIIKTDDTVIDGSLDKKLRDVKEVIGK